MLFFMCCLRASFSNVDVPHVVLVVLSFILARCDHMSTTPRKHIPILETNDTTIMTRNRNGIISHSTNFYLDNQNSHAYLFYSKKKRGKAAKERSLGASSICLSRECGPNCGRTQKRQRLPLPHEPVAVATGRSARTPRNQTSVRHRFASLVICHSRSGWCCFSPSALWAVVLSILLLLGSAAVSPPPPLVVLLPPPSSFFGVMLLSLLLWRRAAFQPVVRNLTV